MKKAKSEPIKEVIEVEITNIQADERYYSFNWKVKRNGKVFEKDWYESDYENGNTPEQMVKDLKDGYAVELVLGSAFN